ncbi:hypothetical protein GCM10027610_107730 [Dactylosporangium cerinum]
MADTAPPGVVTVRSISGACMIPDPMCDLLVHGPVSTGTLREQPLTEAVLRLLKRVRTHYSSSCFGGYAQ